MADDTPLVIGVDIGTQSTKAVLCAVDGYIHSCWPVARAASSIVTIGVPASAVASPGAISTTARARDMSITSPPGIGIACP